MSVLRFEKEFAKGNQALQKELKRGCQSDGVVTQLLRSMNEQTASAIAECFLSPPGVTFPQDSTVEQRRYVLNAIAQLGMEPKYYRAWVRGWLQLPLPLAQSIKKFEAIMGETGNMPLESTITNGEGPDRHPTLRCLPTAVGKAVITLDEDTEVLHPVISNVNNYYLPPTLNGIYAEMVFLQQFVEVVDLCSHHYAQVSVAFSVLESALRAAMRETALAGDQRLEIMALMARLDM